MRRHPSCLNSRHLSCLNTQCWCLRSLNCGNITMFKSQIGGLALNRRKWLEMGPEWSPGPENRPPGMPRPFPRLWDRSRGPKPRKNGPKPESGLSWRRLSGSTPQVATCKNTFGRHGGCAGTTHSCLGSPRRLVPQQGLHIGV